MKYLWFMIKSAWANIMSYKKMLLIIIPVLALLFAMALAFFSTILEEAGIAKRNDEEERTYKIYLHGWAIPTISEVDHLLFGEEYPKVEKLRQPMEVSSYTLIPSHGANSILIGEENKGYELFKSGFRAIAVFPKDREVYSVTEKSLLSGRWFTEEELRDGRQVVVVNDYWLISNGYEQTTQEILIDAVLYKVVGVCAYDSDNPYSQNYIPYVTTFFSTETTGFTPDFRAEVTFVKPLTKAQCISIQELFLFGGMEGREVISNADYDIRENKSTVYITLVELMLLFAVCCVNVLGIFRYILGKNIYKILVYKVCGATDRDCGRILYLTAIMISGFAVIFGNLFFTLISCFIDLSLPAIYRAIISVLYVLMLVISVVFTVLKFSRLMPLEDKTWYLYGE